LKKKFFFLFSVTGQKRCLHLAALRWLQPRSQTQTAAMHAFPTSDHKSTKPFCFCEKRNRTTNPEEQCDKDVKNVLYFTQRCICGDDNKLA
jgi:hypothetical protein